ncbi:MAG: aldehyde dehydrogenase family protein [Planctomycetota bacterium]
MSNVSHILVGGAWRDADASDTFQPVNPATGDVIGPTFPVSRWSDVDAALAAAEEAFEQMDGGDPETFAGFLDAYADGIDANADDLADIASQETALPAPTRLKSVEIPRTSNQLRLSAAAARDGGWALPTIDKEQGVRSMHCAIGPVAVFGPNNFPFAYNGICGGDFAAAVAAGNPVIAKAHPLHPETTRRLGVIAKEALDASRLPSAAVQLLYHISNDDGLRLARDPRLAAIGFTGSKRGGLALKAAADDVGTPAYLELGSINPVVLMPAAMKQRGGEIAEQYSQSCLLGVGQFCTNPGLVFVTAGGEADAFLETVRKAFADADADTLFGKASADGLLDAIGKLTSAGAEVLTGGERVGEAQVTGTLLRVDGSTFLANAEALQTEAFGPSGLVVVCDSVDQIVECLRHVEGNLTGSLYADDGDDYETVERVLRRRVGRLINDKMPTGVAVSPAMNHGGPFPASGHAGFTAVGPPATLRRFSQLRCYDNVREDRLPAALRD